MMGNAGLYPFLFTPVYMHYVWGGDRIARTYNRGLPAGVYAESWEISARPEGMSVVANGHLAGRNLKDLVLEFGDDLLGPCSRDFPLLFKLIDSRECLSVQVHPSETNAEMVGGEAKTEMWYVLAADPGARVFAGLVEGVGEPEFTEALRAGRISEALDVVPVSAGDAVYIPGGRVHAIDKGCLLLEVQQNSNTTYRVYDWGRVGADGKARRLDIERAMKVMNWTDRDMAKHVPHKTGPLGESGSISKVLSCPFFAVELLDVVGSVEIDCDGSGFHALFTEAGDVAVEAGGVSVSTCAGVSCLIPASLPRYSLSAGRNGARVVRTLAARRT